MSQKLHLIDLQPIVDQNPDWDIGYGCMPSLVFHLMEHYPSPKELADKSPDDITLSILALTETERYTGHFVAGGQSWTFNYSPNGKSLIMATPGTSVEVTASRCKIELRKGKIQELIYRSFLNRDMIVNHKPHPYCWVQTRMVHAVDTKVDMVPATAAAQKTYWRADTNRLFRMGLHHWGLLVDALLVGEHGGGSWRAPNGAHSRVIPASSEQLSDPAFLQALLGFDNHMALLRETQLKYRTQDTFKLNVRLNMEATAALLQLYGVKRAVINQILSDCWIQYGDYLRLCELSKADVDLHLESIREVLKYIEKVEL